MAEVQPRQVDAPGSPRGLNRSPSTFSPMKAFRSMSIGSQLSSSSESDITFSLAKRRNTLQKGRTTTTTTVYEDLNRNPSKSSRASTTRSGSGSASASASGSQTTSIHDDFISLIHHGPLQPESSMLKTKKEYLVLTNLTLNKYKSRSAATDSFPQISAPRGRIDSPLSPSDSMVSFKDCSAHTESHVPLDKVVSVFKSESARPSFGIEVWWRGSTTSFSCWELEFNLPEDRDEWLKQIQNAVNVRCQTVPDDEVPSDIVGLMEQILEAKYLTGSSIEVYPVIPRRPYTRLRPNSGENKKGWRDGFSFYLAFSKTSCVIAQFSKSSNSHKANQNMLQFGVVTIARVNASHQDERFDLIHRLPLDIPVKLQLSSRHHRTILTKLFKADTFIKPAWPHWTRREVFLIDGDPHHIHLTEGDDFGGFKRSLDAFLEGYRSQPVNWTAQWKNVRYAPEFRLLPPTGGRRYTAHQLLAVFRALRYNDYFKSLSFCDVDFSSLAGAVDNRSRLESTTWLSRTGKRSLTRAEFELVENASVLFQEIVALLLGAESLRHIDLTNVLSQKFNPAALASGGRLAPPESRECEIVAPIVLLWKSEQTRCNSVNLSGNPLAVSDVAGLSRILQSRPHYLRSLNCSRCGLDDNALALLWDGLHEQRHSIEAIDLSENSGTIEASTITETLNEAKRLRRVDLSHVLKGDVHGPLFSPWKISPEGSQPWKLEEMNLSGWNVNFDTLAALSKISEHDSTRSLRRLVLNNCGLTGELVTTLFCQLGSDRDVELSISENPLETGSVDWIDMIHGNEAPKRLRLDMIHFQDEFNFQKLLLALTNNQSIESLSLVGTGPQILTSSETTDFLSAFFENNKTVRSLDLSGFDGKLEDAHMGIGLAGSLGGLKDNTSLRQLRIRHHDIGAAEDVTELCRLLASNKGLKMLDCQGNNFNHHQFAKIVHALELNHQIISFPLTATDRDFALHEERRVLTQNVGKSGVPALVSSLGKPSESRIDNALKWLGTHWDSEARKVTEAMRRNRDEYANNPLVDLALDLEHLDAWEDEDLMPWMASLARNRDQQQFSANRYSPDRMSMQSSLT